MPARVKEEIEKGPAVELCNFHVATDILRRERERV